MGRIKGILKLKKNKNFLIVTLSFLIFFLILIISFKIIILKNIKESPKWALKDINFSLKGINLEDLAYTETWISVKMDKVKLKPYVIENAFAFEGPGELFSEYEKKKISVEGKIKGNIASGNVSITGTNINIENTGNLKFYGTLTNWGKEKFEGIIELNGLKIKEISEITKYKINFDGKVYGKIFIEKEKENVKEIRFNLNIEDLSQKGVEGLFSLSIKGRYIPFEKRGVIEEGILKNEKGEKLTFYGFLKENEFEFYFDTEEFSLEEFLKLLPEEIKKKYNLKMEKSKVVLNKFSLNISKKKLIFLAIYFSSQKFLGLKTLNLKI